MEQASIKPEVGDLVEIETKGSDPVKAKVTAITKCYTNEAGYKLTVMINNVYSTNIEPKCVKVLEKSNQESNA